MTRLPKPPAPPVDARHTSAYRQYVEIHDDNALVIYTDGSCLPRPRRGGFAYLLVSVDQAGAEVTFPYNPPGRLGATNNEMELTAVVEALRAVTGSGFAGPSGALREDRLLLRFPVRRQPRLRRRSGLAQERLDHR
jgi:RNase H